MDMGKLKGFVQKHTWKQILERVVKSDASPHQIAMGAALGLFLSVIPTFAVGMVLAIYIAHKMRWNLLATYVGTMIVNPFTFSFFYASDYAVGSFLLGKEILISEPITWQLVPSIAGQLYLGGVIVAAISAVLLYFFLYGLMIRFKK